MGVHSYHNKPQRPRGILSCHVRGLPGGGAGRLGRRERKGLAARLHPRVKHGFPERPARAPYPRPSLSDRPRAALPLPGRRRGALSGPPHQASSVPGAGQAGKPQHLTGFSQGPLGDRGSVWVCVRAEVPGARHGIPSDIKGGDHPHFREMEPLGIKTSKPKAHSAYKNQSMKECINKWNNWLVWLSD